MRKTLILVDESHTLFRANDDALKEELRAIDGVPNATYEVQDRRVWVFDKLVSLVKQRLTIAGCSASIRNPVILSLVPDAWMSPITAIEEWRVVPYPYRLDQSGDGYNIVHCPFEAKIPGSFPTLTSAQAALSKLLIGDIVPGEGTITHRGQPLSATLPDDHALPARPVFDTSDLPSAPYTYAALESVTFEPGYIGADTFARLRDLEATWSDATARAAFHARTNAIIVALWNRMAEFPLTNLNDAADTLPDYATADLSDLRRLYPELAALSDAALYDQYDTYQANACYISGWTAWRDDGFLFYLLGRLAGCESRADGERAVDVGRMVAFAFSRGTESAVALRFGADWSAYDLALNRMTHRTSEAMRFLHESRAATDLRGPKVFTSGDLLRIGRKHNSRPLRVTQTLDDPAV